MRIRTPSGEWFIWVLLGLIALFAAVYMGLIGWGALRVQDPQERRGGVVPEVGIEPTRSVNSTGF